MRRNPKVFERTTSYATTARWTFSRSVLDWVLEKEASMPKLIRLYIVNVAIGFAVA